MTPPFFGRALLACAALHLVLQLGWFLPAQLGRTDTERDLVVYYMAGKAVQAGEDLYRPWPEYGPHYHAGGTLLEADRFLYPPPAAAAFSLLARLSYPAFSRTWHLAMVLCFWAYAASLARVATGRTGGRDTLMAGLFLGLIPGAYDSLGLGNVDPLLWALFGWGLASARWRGALMAAASVIKPHAALPLLLAFLREGKRVALPAAAVLGGALVVGAAAVPGGARSFADWAVHVLPTVPSQGTFNPYNVSLSMAGLRLARLLGWEYGEGPLAAGARLYLAAAGTMVPLAAAWAARRRDRLVLYMTAMGAVTLFSPLCWVEYLPLLAPAAAIWVRKRRCGGTTYDGPETRGGGPAGPRGTAP